MQEELKARFVAGGPVHRAAKTTRQAYNPGANLGQARPVSGPFTFYEFFAGGGMAGLGLGQGWRCLLANDIDPKKAAAYADNFGAERLIVADVARLSPADLPGRADLAWASFPCQDLSLAGLGAGLGGPNSKSRSGSFWPFWRLMRALASEGRAPRTIMLENVVGVLTSRGGADFAAIGEALSGAGYRFGALVADAAAFTPQSRPRVFILATRDARGGGAAAPDPRWHPPSVVRARDALPAAARRRWIWWAPAPPPPRTARLADLIEPDAAWDPPEATARLLAMMSPRNRQRLEAARAGGEAVYGTAYRRTRAGLQRAECRFDGLAGCLRTPAGGSSRQILIRVSGNEARSRLLTAREAARLMGAPESYRLPPGYTDAYHLIGDAVSPPVVRWLARSLIEPRLNVQASHAA